MRRLATAVLSLSTCLFVLGATVAPADARVRRHRAPAAVKTVQVAAKPGFNADGTLHPPVIEDAPATDYERVAWCHGILSGDMELAETIDAVMPVDKTLRLIGQSYLRGYEAALTLSGKGATEAGHKRAEAAQQRGFAAWQGALDSARDAASLDKAVAAYATWQLPGECEHAAVRLSGHPNLFAEMATDQEVDAISEVMTSGGPHDYKELPKPVLTAQTADPADADAPIATNTLARRVNQAKELPTIPAAAAKTGDDAPDAAKP